MNTKVRIFTVLGAVFLVGLLLAAIGYASGGYNGFWSVLNGDYKPVEKVVTEADHDFSSI